MGANSSSMQDSYENIIKEATARLAHAPDTDKAGIYLERGAALFHLKRYEEALIDYNQATELEPGNVDAYHLRAELYAVLNRDEAAIADYSQAIRLDATSTRSYLLRSKIYLKLKKYSEAIEDYAKAIELAPQKITTYRLRAEAFAQLEHYEEAIADYTKILEISPEYADAYVGRARMYSVLKRHEQAIKECTDALRLDEKNIAAYCERGSVYEQALRQIVDDQGEDYINLWQKAYDDYTAAIRLEPRNPELYICRLKLYLSSNYDRGEIRRRFIQDCGQAMRITPNHPMAYCLHAKMHELSESGKQKIPGMLQELIRLDPNNSDVYCLAYYFQNKYGISVAGMPETKSLIDKAIELDPENLRARRLRAKVNDVDFNFWKQRVTSIGHHHHTQYSHGDSSSSSLKDENYQKYIDDCTIIITCRPQWAAYATRAIVYSILGKYQEAVADCRECLSFRRNSISDIHKTIEEIFFIRMRASFSKGDYPFVVENCTKFAEAIEAYSSAIELVTQKITTYRLRAEAFAQLERYEEAIADYTKILEISPEYADAYVGRARIYSALKRYEQGIEDYTNILRLDEKNVAAYCARGSVYEQAMRQIIDDQGEGYVNLWEKAHEDYTSAIRLEPRNPELYICRLKLYLRKHDYGQSDRRFIQDCGQVMWITPNHPMAYCLHAKMHELSESEKPRIPGMLQELVRLDPNNSDVYCLVYYLQNKYGISVAAMPETKSLIDKAIELNPENLRARRLRARMNDSTFNARLWEDAYQNFRSFFLHEPSPPIDSWETQVLLSDGYYQKYVDDFTVIIQYQPRYEVYARRAMIHGVLGKYCEAVTDCIKSVSFDRDRSGNGDACHAIGVFFLIIQASLHKGRYSFVVENCTKFIEIEKEPHVQKAYVYRAFANFYLKNDYEGIISDITHCHLSSNDLYPISYRDLYLCRAQAYLMLFRYDEAISDCTMVRRCSDYSDTYESQQFILSILAEAYLKTSRFREALKDSDEFYYNTLKPISGKSSSKGRKFYDYYSIYPENDSEICSKICCIRIIACIKLGRYREAVESHQQALRIDQFKPEAYFRGLGLDQKELAHAYVNIANEIHRRTKANSQPPAGGSQSSKKERAQRAVATATSITTADSQSTQARRARTREIRENPPVFMLPPETEVFVPLAGSSAAISIAPSVTTEASQPTAFSLYLEAARLAPSSSYVFHQLGLYYFSEKQYEKAIESFLQAISLAPKLASISIDLSFAYYFLGNYNLAIQALEKNAHAILKDRKGREIWVLAYSARGRALFEEKKYEEAVHDYTQIIDHELGRVEDYRNRAEAYCYLGRYQEVIKDCTTILEREPHYEEAYYYRAFAYQKLNQHADAVEDCTAAIKHNARRLHTYFYRLESYLKLNQHAEAIEDHKTAFKLDRKQTLDYFAKPQHEAVLSELLRAYLAHDSQDKDKAIVFCSELVKLEPRSWCAFQYLGELYFLKGKYQKAMEALTQAMALKPGFPEILIARAKVFTKLERHSEARDHLLEAQRLNPRDKQICIDLVFYHYSLEEYDQADELLTKEQEFILGNTEGKKLWCLVYMARGKTYLDAGRYENAIQNYTKVIEENPHHLDAYRHRAVACHKAKKYDQAKEDYNKIIEYEPQNWEAYTCRAEVSYYLENYEDAIRDYDRVLAAQSNNPKVYAQRGFIHRKLCHYEEVIRDYTEALKSQEYVHNPKIYYALIESYLNLNRFSEATKTYETVLKLIPNSAISNLQQAAQRELLPPLLRAYMILGEQAKSRSQFKEAMTCYLHSIQLAPETYEGFYQLGICHLALNELDQAIKAFNQAIVLNKNLAELYVLRAQAYQKKNDHDQAIRDFIAARDLGDASFPMYFGLGHSFYTLGRHHQAIEILERQQELILSQPAGKELWYLAYIARGNAHFDAQENEGAITDYTQVIELYETERLRELPSLIKQAYQNRAIAYERLEQKDYESAIKDYTVLLGYYPQDQDFYYARALAFVNLRQHAQALADFEVMLSFNPNHIEILYKTQCSLYELGRYRDATRIFRNILVTIAPDHLDALFVFGQCLQRQGENPRQAESVKDEFLKEAESVFLQIIKKEQSLKTPRDDLLKDCNEALAHIEASRKLRGRSVSSSRDQDLEETEYAPSEAASEYSKGSDETLFYRHPHN